jgi:hypothetical protein
VVDQCSSDLKIRLVYLVNENCPDIFVNEKSSHDQKDLTMTWIENDLPSRINPCG